MLEDTEKVGGDDAAAVSITTRCRYTWPWLT